MILWMDPQDKVEQVLRPGKELLVELAMKVGPDPNRVEIGGNWGRPTARGAHHAGQSPQGGGQSQQLGKIRPR